MKGAAAAANKIFGCASFFSRGCVHFSVDPVIKAAAPKMPMITWRQGWGSSSKSPTVPVTVTPLPLGLAGPFRSPNCDIVTVTVTITGTVPSTTWGCGPGQAFVHTKEESSNCELDYGRHASRTLNKILPLTTCSNQFSFQCF